MYNSFPIKKIQIQVIIHGYQVCLNPDDSENVMSKLVQDLEYVKTIIIC
jgi:hypothetical protein